MAQAGYRCPKCQKTMEEGHVPDHGHNSATQSGWAHGPPERIRFFGGIKVRNKELLPLSAYRCLSCGFVEFYARSI